MTRGLETLAKMEGVETKREGIFVMPKQRVTIHSTYVHCDRCARDAAEAKQRLGSLTKELERHRSARLPGN